MTIKKLARYIITVALLLLILGIFSQRQFLKDEYIVRTTKLQSSAATLEPQLDLTQHGSFLYAASQAQLQDSTAFNSSCKNVTREQSIVLGCYTNQKIYIFDVKDPQLNGVEQVTAAHELLHAAYDRMTVSQKRTLDHELESQAKKITDPRLLDTIAQYRKTEPNDVVNELHSIFGTEVAVLSPELEAHYKLYFKNRQKIVQYSQQYEKTFTDIDNQIALYDKQLAGLKSQKDQLDSDLKIQRQQIDAKKAQLNTLNMSGDIESYNALVPVYNGDVRDYNATLGLLRQTIDDYNNLVKVRNGLASTQNNLVHQLDSKYQPL